MVAPKRILALGAGALLLLCLIPFVARAVRTDVSRDFPIYHNNGLPDLTIDAKRFVSQTDIVDRLFDSSSCEIIEGSVGGTGYRRLLRFETTIINKLKFVPISIPHSNWTSNMSVSEDENTMIYVKF